ncbi:MAG: hypothetical protein MN733_35990, partial [Nitrososphaera sp.]|nr:hypothetical protein [Nitrososphaera sp.]
MKIVTVLVLASILGAVIAILIASYSYFQNDVSVQGSASDDLFETDLPIRFENATNLTNNGQDSVYGQIVAANEYAYLVWQESVQSIQGDNEGYTLRNYDVFIKKSGDKGDTFGDPINLSNNPGFSEHPQASAYGDNVYAVWADDSSGNREVVFTRSLDNATTFEKTVNLSNNTSDS